MSEAAAVREGKRAVLLLAHGTPDSPDEIPRYLLNVTSGRHLPPEAVEEIRRRYTLIGKSPLTTLTLEQGRLLGREIDLPVYVGMRNWKPYIADVVAQLRADRVTSAVAICLAPQNSRTSVGLYRRAVFAEARGAIAIDFIEEWAGDPLLAQAFAERLEPLWRSVSAKIGRAAPVLFTAHSVPCRTIQTDPSGAGGTVPDPYPQDAKRTAANVAALLAPSGFTERDWFFAFQSQGVSGGPWLGPTIEDALTSLRQEGHTTVIIHPIGFLCDHVEILYDIDIGFHAFGAGIGLEITRPPSLNDSPLLIAALANLARQGFARLDASSEVLEAGAASRSVP
jgi:ferrochelatase